jgi:GGDEF domain/HD domain protein
MENKSNTVAKILIIDDDVNMMDILSVILKKYGHEVVTFSDPVAAIGKLKEEKFDILIVNYLMSPINGEKIVELVRQFDKELYIILMSIHKDLKPSIETMKSLDIQAYFEKSTRFDQLILFVQSGIKYLEQMKRIKDMNLKLERYLIDFANILLNTVGAKDHFTESHSQNVSKLCVAFGKKLQLSFQEIENLRLAGLFHDIGKIGIPDSILLKQGKLTDEEYETMKLHPIMGANIFALSEVFKKLSPIIIAHHERVDGKGYPNKLSGDDIPYLAKILAICDSFDAMISKRSYKEAKNISFAINQIKECSGTQFDPKLAESFVKFYEEDPSLIREIYPNTEI